MASLSASKSRALLAAWLAAVFAVSAITDIWALAGGYALTLIFFWRGALGVTRKVLISVAPLISLLVLGSWGWLWLLQRRPPLWTPFAALALRTALIATITFSVLARVNLLRALAPWPTLTRLLVISLAQIHALRLLATDSRLGLRSRLLRKPGAADLVRSSGGITGALLTLTIRNARDVSDAMRSRGF